MKTKLHKVYIFLFSILVLTSCDDLIDDGRLSEGVIEYEVTYPKMDPNSILAELLPTKMIMHFKNNQYHNELSAGFGMFKMNVINLGEDHEMIQMVKLINEKYVVEYDEISALQSLESFPQITIQETGKTKMIAEYKCNEAIVTVNLDSLETFKIYFTNEIHLDQANWFTRFSGIEGVLMEYQVERYNLCTRFTAIDVTAQEVDDKIFEIPEQYENVDEEKMTAKMEDIFNSFSE